MSDFDDRDKTRVQPPRAGRSARRSAADVRRLKSKARAKAPHKPSTVVIQPNPDEVKTEAAAVQPTMVDPSGSLSSKARAHNISVHPDDVLKGRFVLEKILGAGGMGVVYRAKDLLKVEAKDRDPYVAIKVLGEDFKSHPEAFIALQRESRKTQRIAHPNIVNVYDFDKDGDTVFMTMEYLDGIPLDKLIKKHRATGLPRADVWRILDGLCAALAYAHQQNIIHSDLKPGNIFVTKQTRTKVFDFGIARAVAKAEHLEETEDDKTLFDAGKLRALTPTYASLEMLEGEAPDVRDDIYALGCIAYEMYTGRHPYKRKNAREALKRGLKPKRIEGISKRQWRVIERSLALRRDDRIGTVREFWSLLSKKYRRPYAVWAALVVLSITTGTASMLYLNPDEPPPQLSEDDFRSEIESRVRLELLQDNIGSLLEVPAFDRRWASNLADEVATLRQLQGSEHPQIGVLLEQIYNIYLTRIQQEVANGQFELARTHIEGARAYTRNQTELDDLLSDIEQQVADIERKRQEQLERERLAQQKSREAEHQARQQAQQQQRDVARDRRTFDAALANVHGQLSCVRTPNMGDLTIAVENLRDLDRAWYQQAEGEIVTNLSSCIEKTARNSTSRATTLRSDALVLFPGNKVLRELEFVAQDPCNPALAGLGARGQRTRCHDPLASGGRTGPMVIVPPLEGGSPFAMGRYEISVAQFNRFCEAVADCEPAAHDSGLPVTGVALPLVKKYLAWLSEESGRVYRLPSHAEWVHATEGEDGRLDPNRNCLMDSRNIRQGGALVNAAIGQQNSWGLVNQIGNAREWVSTSGNKVLAVGGSYATEMTNCTSATKVESDGQSDVETGFRVVRELATR